MGTEGGWGERQREGERGVLPVLFIYFDLIVCCFLLLPFFFFFCFAEGGWYNKIRPELPLNKDSHF